MKIERKALEIENSHTLKPSKYREFGKVVRTARNDVRNLKQTVKTFNGETEYRITEKGRATDDNERTNLLESQ